MLHRPLGRMWLIVVSLAAGCLMGPLRFAPAMALGGAVVFISAGPGAARLAGILIFAWGSGSSAAGLDRAPPEMVSLAASFARCDLRVRFLEDLPGPETLVAVEVARCGPHGSWSHLGKAAVHAEAASGMAMIATGWLTPVGEGSFAADSGAGAELSLLDSGRPFADRHDLRLSFRRSLGDALSVLPDREAALMQGLVIGDTTYIEAVDEASLRRSGLAHLVAVSGSNVAIVAGAALLLLRRGGPYIALPGAAALLVFYVWVVGMDASVLRAAAMGSLTLLALVWGLRPEPLTALGAAIVLVLALRPALVSSVGLHLSVAAVGGMILWTRSLERRMARIPPWMRLPMAASLAAQVAVAPLLALSFGSVSPLAPLSNVAAAAAVPVATLGGFAAGVLGWVHPAAGRTIAVCAGPSVSWILHVARTTAEISWAQIEVGSHIAMLMCLAVLGAMAASVRRRMRPL